jgi:carbonic anhydrase
MRARIKGGVENVSRSVVMHHDSCSAIHAAREKASQIKKNDKNKSKIKIKRLRPFG